MIIFYLLVSMMPMDQYHLWGLFLGAGTVIKYVGLLCILYAMFHLPVRRQAPPSYFATLQAPIFLLFIFLTFISYILLGGRFSLHSSVLMSCLSIAFLFFVVLTVVDTLNRLRWTILTAVGSMALASLYVFKEWVRDPWWRPGSVSGDANYFALNICLVLPLALLIVFRSRVLWERLFALGCIVAMIIANTLGASRGGLIGLSVAVGFLIWNSRRRMRNFAIIAVLVIPPLVLLPSSPLRRLLSPQYSDLAGEQDRLIAWKAGLRMIEQHPLAGVGLGEFKPKMLEYADPGTPFSSIAHNTYIELAAETGVPTFLVFLAILIFTYHSLSRTRRRTPEAGPPVVQIASLGLQAGLVGYFVGAFFLSAEYQKLFWLWVFLAMALPSLAVAPAEQRQTAGVFALRPAWRGLAAGWTREGEVREQLPEPAGNGYRTTAQGAARLARHPGAVRKD